jgi:hypothetical protein
MKIINESGDYTYIDSTRTVKTSDHPVHQARIELALAQGHWAFAPNRGHQLKKFQTLDQTPSNMQSFRKELLLYLDKYSPEVQEAFGERGLVDMALNIDKEISNG